MSEHFVYGFHPVREALRLRATDVAEVIVSDRRQGPRRREIEKLAASRDVAVVILPEAALDRLAEGVHNGFAARLSGAQGGAEAAGEASIVVLAEDIQDPRNLGALLRVCDGAGVNRVLVRDRGSAPLSPVAIKASAGAGEWLNVERVPNSAAAIEELQADGYWVYGAAPEGKPAWEIDLTDRVALCIGGEADGLRKRTRDLCDGLISVPMRGRVESLNLSTAAAAILYEAVRQRAAKS